MDKIELNYKLKTTGVKNLAELKSRLSRIQQLTNELGKEIDAVIGTSITFEEI